MAELIADCADIPAPMRPVDGYVPLTAPAAPWTVDDICLAQVNDLDEFV